MYGVIRRIRRFRKGEKGFTLIELLVVIIIIAILAAIAIPTFLGQRQKAQDAAAKALVRNARTAIEAYFVDYQSYASSAAMTTAVHNIEPSINFSVVANVVTNAGVITPANVTASTVGNNVNYDGTASTFCVATRASSSTHYFGMYVDKGTGATQWAKNIDATNTASAISW